MNGRRPASLFPTRTSSRVRTARIFRDTWWPDRHQGPQRAGSLFPLEPVSGIEGSGFLESRARRTPGPSRSRLRLARGGDVGHDVLGHVEVTIGLFTQMGHKMPRLELRRAHDQKAIRCLTAAAQRAGEIERLDTEFPQIPDQFLQVPGGDIHGQR